MDDFDNVQIPFIRKLMVQAADDVQLGGAVAIGLRSPLKNLLTRHHIALGVFQIRAKRAEYAAINADIGRVNVRVDVVISEVAVLPLANEIGELGQREQIV